MKGFLLDARNTEINIEIKDFKLILDFVKEHQEIFKGKRIAVVTSDSRKGIIPSLVEAKSSSESNVFQIRAFFDYSSAKYWALSKWS
ncbi:MAG: hypothetical protein KIT33_10275 [Candidatus Kapabacteria bacterium]|nr:hypothetical protein [Ignavibacteriota bacterium]MCW5885344.1 hypothetical protein [Candidatus Kapabacteria bacterium]